MKFKIDPKLRTVCIMLLVWSLVHLCWYIANHARPYGSPEGANWGVAWDVGGYELKGEPGPFLCKSDTNWGEFPWSAIGVDC